MFTAFKWINTSRYMLLVYILYYTNEYTCININLFLQVDIIAIADEANDRHAGPWANACRKGGIKNTPLSTFIISEQLLNRHIKLDNSKLKSTGFRFLHPQISEELIRDVITI